jgi:hypothetical protein
MKEIFFKAKGELITTLVDSDIYDYLQENNARVHAKVSGNKIYAKVAYRKGKKMLSATLGGVALTKDLEWRVPHGYVVDHVNGNSLDNRKENLRQITWRQNSQNRAPTNRFLGVRQVKDKFHSACNVFIGSFNTEEEAARAYDAKLLQNPSLGVRLNFEYTQEEIAQIIEAGPKIKKPKRGTKLKKSFNECDRSTSSFVVTRKNQISRCFVDECHLDHILNCCKWSLHENGYVHGFVERKSVYLHRYIFQNFMNDGEKIPEKMYVDHIQGDTQESKKLDNRKANLRLINAEQNSFNKILVTPTGYRGIHKHGPSWRAQLTFEKQKLNSKVFATINEAAEQWNEFVRQTFGKKYGEEFIAHNLNRIL